MRCRLYARVSHANGDQDPEVQLSQLRAFVQAKGWEIISEYVDKAPAINARKRTAWASIMRDAEPGEAIVTWRLDRSFRSTLQAAQDVEALKARGVSFVSMMEGFDLTTPAGQLMFDLLAAFAAFERRVIRERIIAGQQKARERGTRSGLPIGRPVGWRKRPAGEA